MKITNNRAYDLTLGFVSDNGKVLPASSSIIVEDRYSSHTSLRNMISAGHVSISSFGVSDDRATESPFNKDPYSSISPAEFNNLAKGLYIVSSTWAKTGTVTAAAAYAITGSHIGPFDTTTKNVLQFLFDGLSSVTVEFGQGQLDIDTTISFLNAHTEFTKYAIASKSSEKLVITSRCLGTNSNIEIVDNARNAVEKFYLLEVVETPATGTVATISIPTLNPIGIGLEGVQHTVKLYQVDAPGTTLSAQFKIQRVTNGTLISGIYTNTAVIETGVGGLIEFEVAAATISETYNYVGIALPAAHFLAQIPTERLLTYS